MEGDNTILFHITEDQARILCQYYGKSNLEDYEICELLDRAIDELAKSLQ